MNTGIRRWLRRTGGSAWRLCSLRNFVSLLAGAVLVSVPLVSGPSPAGTGVQLLPYSPTYAHQAYGYSLAQSRLQADSAGRGWLAAADRALLEPQPVDLPFVDRGEFSANSAAGYSFNVAPGRRVHVAVSFDRAEAQQQFIDLFQRAGGRYERVAGALPRGAAEPFAIDVVEGGDYVLRVQPELAAAGGYDVRIGVTPLLVFPVVDHGPRAIWSGFGADRDGGRRAHRGVDIFAARGTAVLAATDGWVVRVETTRVGGNVVWQQPLFGEMRLYYAHLDQQWVQNGDFVVAGQPLGAVGNTGNAVTTPPHLHFGVYVRRPGVRGGARDPAVFLR